MSQQPGFHFTYYCLLIIQHTYVLEEMFEHDIAMDLKVRLKSKKSQIAVCALYACLAQSDKERLAESSPIWVDQFHRKASDTRMLMIVVICVAFLHFCNKKPFSKLPPDKFRSSALTKPAISLNRINHIHCWTF